MLHPGRHAGHTSATLTLTADGDASDGSASDPNFFTVHSVRGMLDGHAAWAGELPAPQVLPVELVEEGRAIPVARVQAMHEGKRRKRAREAQ